MAETCAEAGREAQMTTNPAADGTNRDTSARAVGALLIGGAAAVFTVCSIVQGMGHSSMFSTSYPPPSSGFLDLLMNLTFFPGWMATVGLGLLGFKGLATPVTTSDRPGAAATRTATVADRAVVRKESPVLPAGNLTCQRLNCSMRGVPTQDERCGACGFAAVPLTAFRGDVMSAPGVAYNPTAAVQVEPESVASTPPVSAEDPDGELTCIRLNCDRRRLRTTAERCPSCGHHTALATSS
jgi:hypothetical protein